MKKKLLILIFFLGGCVTIPEFSYKPDTVPSENDTYSAKLDFVAKYESLYNGMVLTIQNKTENEIEVVWDKTHYLDNGQTNGGFMFAGIIYADRNNPKPNDIIFPKSTIC